MADVQALVLHRWLVAARAGADVTTGTYDAVSAAEALTMAVGMKIHIEAKVTHCADCAACAPPLASVVGRGDAHTATAARLYGKDITAVTAEERAFGRWVNFAMSYRFVPPLTAISVFGGIKQERERQDAQHGDQTGISDLKWLTILTEEVGEAAKEVLEVDYVKLRAEVLQVAAVAVAWLEALALRTEVR